jgi:hypothetical protein
MNMVTNHNTDNAPMIAIDRKLGYVQTPAHTGWKNTRGLAYSRVTTLQLP